MRVQPISHQYYECFDELVDDALDQRNEVPLTPCCGACPDPLGECAGGGTTGCRNRAASRSVERFQR